MIATTFSVDPLMTETALEPAFATEMYPFEESNATPTGKDPTPMVAITLSFAPLMTETLLESSFAT